MITLESLYELKDSILDAIKYHRLNDEFNLSLSLDQLQADIETVQADMIADYIPEDTSMDDIDYYEA